MKEWHAEIEIATSAEGVWRVLADFPSYPQWNPLITRVSGRPRIGERLELRLEPPGARGVPMRAKVITAEPNHELRWRGHLLSSRVLDGDHSFVIEPLEEDRVRFIQREVFRGLLVPLFARTFARRAQQGYEEMNLALKQRCEAPPAKAP